MLDIPCKADYEGLIRNLWRQGTPERVYHLELVLDPEVEDALIARLLPGVGQHYRQLHPARQLSGDAG